MKIECMFDIKVVKRYYNLKEGATDWRRGGAFALIAWLFTENSTMIRY